MIEHDLFLPSGYRENPPQPTDAEGESFWADATEARLRNKRQYQVPVYRLAARFARRHGAQVILDIGCGTGENLARHVGTVTDRIIGVDQPRAIEIARRSFPDCEWIAGDLRSEELWARLRALDADLAVCADVIEHLADPRELLGWLHDLAGPSGTVILSTPDRARLEDQNILGPPRNPKHVREWTFTEMERLLESAGFAIRSARHVLTRRYAITTLDVKILAWRALHLRPVPGRRSCMVFELIRA